MHPLADVLRAAAAGQFPPADGVAEVMPPDTAGTHAVVAFTGHAYLLTDLDRRELAPFAPDGFGAAAHPRLLTHLAGNGGGIGSHDVVLVRHGAADGTDGGPPLLGVSDEWDDHARVQRARRYRRDVMVVGDERGFATIGRGLVDRLEVSVELTGAEHGRGAGRALLRGALAAVPVDEHVFAQVAPGNAASLRAFLACGFVPIGSEVLIEARRPRH